MKRVKVRRLKSDILNYEQIGDIVRIYDLTESGKFKLAKRIMNNISFENVFEDFVLLKEPSKFDLHIIKKMLIVCKIFDVNGKTLMNDEPYDAAMNYYKLFADEPIVEKLQVVSRRVHDTVHKYPELKGTLDKANKFEKKNEEKSYDVSLEPYIRKCFTCVPVGTKLIFILSKKADGNSGVCDVSKNKIDSLTTRGEDGMGIDISHMFKHIRFNYKDDIGLKVEIVISKDNFDKYCTERDNKYASLRSAVASILTSSDAAKYSKYLSLVPLCTSKDYFSPSDLNDCFANDIEFEYKIISGYGYHEIIDQIKKYADQVSTERPNMDYAIDGIVIDCIDKTVREKLGRQNDINKYQIAYKFPPEVRYAKVKEIFTNVGRTGLTVPMVKYTQVYFNGGKHTQSTLSSADRFYRMNLRKNEVIKLTYNGDVLPYPSKYDCQENRDNDNAPFKFPERCQCGYKLVKKGANFYCENPLCSGKKVAAFTHYFKTLGIKDLSYKTVEKLLNNNIFTNHIDAFMMDSKAIMELDGFEAKSTGRIINQFKKLEDSKIPESKIIAALGICGERMAKAILSKVPLDAILKDTKLLYDTKIDKVGEISKDNFMKNFNLLRDTIIILKKRLIIKPIKADDDKVKICFTGWRNKNIALLLEGLGFEVSDNMSKAVSYVLVKNKEGYDEQQAKAKDNNKSTFAKAVKNNIPIYTLEEFKNTILKDIEVDLSI